MVREIIVKVVSEGTFSVAVDLQSNTVKLHDILVDASTILHHKVIELVLHISDGVVRSKVCLEFQGEFVEIIHSCRMERGILHLEEVGFKPLKGHALQV